MTIQNGQRGPVVAAVVGLAAVAISSCDGGGKTTPGSLGRACVPIDEYAPGFSGYDEEEIMVENHNAACGEDSVCLVNHFRGRVTCPYGQTQDDIDSLPGEDERRCVTPARAGEAAPDPVTVPVRPQLEERRSEATVYCSCRCADAAGHDDGRDFCLCPSGFSCEHLVDDLGLGGDDIAGSYCVKQGTVFEQTAPPGASCRAAEPSCGAARPVIDVPDPELDSGSTNQFFGQLTISEVDAGAASCLPRALPLDDDGSIACALAEVTTASFEIRCDTPGRAPLPSGLEAAAREQLEAMGPCGEEGMPSCADLTICQLTPAVGTAMQDCLQVPDAALPDGVYAGYCYVDATRELDGDPATRCEALGDPDCIGNPELVADCDPTQRRLLRFVSSGVEPPVPFGTSTVLIACQGSL